MKPRLEVRRAFYEGKPREQRLAIVGAELREASDGLALSGYASVTGAPYTITDWLGDYSETIARGAFAKSLQERDDVRLLVNHDGIPLARTKSGTLDLREITDPMQDPQGRGQTGLWCDAASLDPASPLVQTVRSAMARGDLSEMSFAFRVTRQTWNGDYTERTINEVQLYDVSVVTYPANPATSVQLNSERTASLASRLREGRALDAEDVNMLTQALGWLSAIDTIVDAGQASLADYLKVPDPDADEEMEPGADDAARSAALEEARQLQALDLAEVDRRKSA